MDWAPLESKLLAAAAYDAPRRQLYLRFHSGEVYRYFTFPAEQYQEFLDAESQGKVATRNTLRSWRASTEPHTEIIRKGKASKPTEFGKMAQIQEAENQIITVYGSSTNDRGTVNSWCRRWNRISNSLIECRDWSRPTLRSTQRQMKTERGTTAALLDS